MMSVKMDSNQSADEENAVESSTSEDVDVVSDELDNSDVSPVIAEQSFMAEELFAAAKVDSLNCDYVSAVGKFEETYKLHCNLYGQVSSQTADVCFEYGCAFLELGKRMFKVGNSNGFNEIYEPTNGNASAVRSPTPSNASVSSNADNSYNQSQSTSKTISSESIEDESVVEPLNANSDIENDSGGNKILNPNENLSEHGEFSRESNGNLLVVGNENGSIDNLNIENDSRNVNGEKAGFDSKTQDYNREPFIGYNFLLEYDETISKQANAARQEGMLNFRSALEKLDIAKCVYLTEDGAKLANTYSKLGEMGIESGNYAPAVVNIKMCLDIQERTLPPGSREIAENLFRLGTAYFCMEKYFDAVKHFTTCGIVLEKRVRNLIRILDRESNDSRICLTKIDLDECKAMLSEIKDKICETEDVIRGMMMSETKKEKNEFKDGTVLSEEVCSKSVVDVNLDTIANKRKSLDDINHKSKRPRLEM